MAPPDLSEVSQQDSSWVLTPLNIADREIAREGMVRRDLAQCQLSLFDSARGLANYGLLNFAGKPAGDDGLMK